MKQIRYSFELDEVEEERYEAWKKTLPKIKDTHFGAIGGGYWFKFRPTGLGTLVEVGRDDVPELNENITNMDLW